jgi:hypothetical protein
MDMELISNLLVDILSVKSELAITVLIRSFLRNSTIKIYKNNKKELLGNKF